MSADVLADDGRSLARLRRSGVRTFQLIESVFRSDRLPRASAPVAQEIEYYTSAPVAAFDSLVGSDHIVKSEDLNRRWRYTAVGQERCQFGDAIAIWPHQYSVQRDVPVDR